MSDNISSDSAGDAQVSTFCEITGASIENAKNYLQVNEGNLDQAVSLFFQNGGVDIHSTEKYVHQPTNTSSAFDYGQGDEVRAPIAPTRDVLFGGNDPMGMGGFGQMDLDDLSDSDFHQPFGSSSSINGVRGTSFGTSVSSSSRGISYIGQTSSSSSSPNVRDETSLTSKEIDDKESQLASMFRPPFEITFREGGLQTAQQMAIKQEKWVLVTIQDNAEFACHALIRDLWNKKDVKELIEKNFIFCYYGSDSSQAKSHINFYPFSSYPYICILDPLTGERVRTWNRAISPTEFISEDFSNRYSDSRPAPQPTKKRPSELTEDEQLAIAIAASMGEVADKDVIELDDDVVEVKLDPFESIKGTKKPEPEGNDTTRLQIKLPDGSRTVRRFNKGDKVRAVFEFVKGHFEVVLGKRFDLLAFRKSLLLCLDQSLEDAGLLNGAVMLEFED